MVYYSVSQLLHHTQKFKSSLTSDEWGDNNIYLIDSITSVIIFFILDVVNN